MKKLVLFLIVTFAMSAHAIAATIYVNDGTFAPGDWCTAAGNNTTGNGSTASPYATLAFALTTAGAGDVVRIDQGTYNNENNVTVNVANVTIEGFNVATTVFQRTSGTLNFLNIAANGVTVRNLTVQNYNSSTAAFGKAITANNVNGVQIYNCAFIGNSSGGGEPAVYSSNTGTTNVAVTIRKCSFRNNIGNYGGGVSITANTTNAASTLTATIDSCYFENNVKGSYYGGAIVIEKGVASAPSAQAPNVTISNSTIGNLCANGGNRAQRGGAVYTDDNSTVTINNTCFSNNTAEDITGPDGGGAIWSGECTLTLNDCKFENNNANVTVAKYGGAIYANGGFNLNALTINRCAFVGNTSNRGGGIYIDHCTALIKNCLFYGNAGTGYGGGIAANDANALVTIYNSTFSNNTTTGAGRGGAIDGNQFQSPMQIKNCIVYGNGTQKEIAGGTNIQVRWSDIGTSSIAGTDYSNVIGNTTANPLFTNSAVNDYTISSTLSPAYNTANTDGGNAPTNDINSINRTTLEMGCYSFGSAPVLRWSCANPTNLASIAGNATSICPGGSVTLTAAPSSGYTYSWSSSPVGFTSTAQTVVVSPTVTTVYQVSINNGSCGVYGIASYTVTVNPAPTTPTITANGPTTFCTGGSVTLTSSVATSYLWSTGATTQAITVNTSGTYSVVVSNASGCTAGSTATTVTVNPNPSTPVVTASGPVSFCSGGTVTLSSSSATNNVWSTGATTQSIVVSTSGTYSVTVSNASGCTAASAATTVTVNPNPAIPTVAANGPLTFCAGDSVVLTSSSTSNNSWNTGDTTQSITVNDSGTYFVTVVNGNGCQAQSAIDSVTVNPLPNVPTVALSGPSTFCSGDSVVLTSSAAFNNTWSTGDTTQTITVFTAGNFSVSVFDINGCSASSASTLISVNSLPLTPVISTNGPTVFCAGDSVILTSNTSLGNQWNTGDTTQSIVVYNSGTYSLYVVDANSCASGSTSDSVQVNALPPLPVVTAQGPTTFCLGDSVLLTSSSTSNNIWSTGALTQTTTVYTSGTYTVMVTDTNGCSSTSSGVTVTANPLPGLPTITASGPTTLCQGGSVTLTSSYPTGNLWSTGSSNASIVVNTSGTYTVVNTNSFGCSSAPASIAVTVNPNPLVDISSLVIDSAFCGLSSGAISGVTVSSGTSPYVYTWYDATGNVAGNGSSLSNLSAGTYYLVVTDNNGCADTTGNLVVPGTNGVQVNLTATPLSGYAPLNVEFTATTTQAVSQYYWDMTSTGYTTSTDTTSFLYTSAGSYDVTVTVTDNNGCTDSDTITILVDEEITIEVPNVFTPNGDGSNDLFLINTTGIDYLKVSIYDRWGVLVAVVEGVNAGWDGRATNGMRAVDGTYYFVLDCITYQGAAINKTGFVTLLH